MEGLRRIKWKKENQYTECSQVGHDQRQLGQEPLGPLRSLRTVNPRDRVHGVTKSQTQPSN